MPNNITRHYEVLLPISGQYTDASTVYVDVQLSAVEAAEFVDDSSFYVDVEFSASEIYSGNVDEVTIPVAVTPSVVDVIESLDAGTAYVDAQLTAVENAQFADSGSLYVDVGFSGEDCYNIATPNYVVDDSGHFEILTDEGHWGCTEVGSHFTVFEVVGNFNNECF
jgi:hypothetical protein